MNVPVLFAGVLRAQWLVIERYCYDSEFLGWKAFLKSNNLYLESLYESGL